jgi:hypothetical protein
MGTVGRLVHAYRITPWRLQRQWIGNLLLAVVALTMVAALYLDVTAQAAIAGREIQDLTAALRSGRYLIADLQTELAASTSAVAMEQRAQALGFIPMRREEADYLAVPGYQEPQPDVLAASSQPQFSAPTISPAYTQSLLDWFEQRLDRSQLLAAGQ